MCPQQLIQRVLEGNREALNDFWHLLLSQEIMCSVEGVLRTSRMTAIVPADIILDLYLELIQEDSSCLRQFQGQAEQQLCAFLRTVAIRKTQNIIRQERWLAQLRQNIIQEKIRQQPQQPIGSSISEEELGVCMEGFVVYLRQQGYDMLVRYFTEGGVNISERTHRRHTAEPLKLFKRFTL